MFYQISRHSKSYALVLDSCLFHSPYSNLRALPIVSSLHSPWPKPSSKPSWVIDITRQLVSLFMSLYLFLTLTGVILSVHVSSAFGSHLMDSKSQCLHCGPAGHMIKHLLAPCSLFL